MTRQWIIGCAAAALLWPAGSLSAAAPDSKAMSQTIAQHFKESGQLSNYRVGVKYQDGVAWLLGSVTSQEQADIACELAKQVDGVEQVVNRLEIIAPVAPAASAKEESADVLLTMLDTPAAQQAPAELAPAPQARPVAKPQAAVRMANRGGAPLPVGARPIRQMPFQQVSGQQPIQQASCDCYGGGAGGGYAGGGGGYAGGGAAGGPMDSANMPGYAWPSYAQNQNYAAVSYPQQYSPTAWPYIGPFYPYPQVPLGWRKVTLEWDDGWWWLDFSHTKCH